LIRLADADKLGYSAFMKSAYSADHSSTSSLYEIGQKLAGLQDK
jgi:hypothetical protein